MDINHNKSDNIESGVVHGIVPVGNDVQLPYLLVSSLLQNKDFSEVNLFGKHGKFARYKITDSGKVDSNLNLWIGGR
jgi:hypothetical protein